MVETGIRFADASGGRIEILKGLVGGERIVTSGNFLLNSESQMKSAGGGGMADMPGMARPIEPVSKPTPEKRNAADMPDMPGMPQNEKTKKGKK